MSTEKSGIQPDDASSSTSATLRGKRRFSGDDLRHGEYVGAAEGTLPPPARTDMPVQEILIWSPARFLAERISALSFLRHGAPRQASEETGKKAITPKKLARRRWIFLILVLATAGAAAARLWNVVRVDGVTWVEGLLLLLFAVLFTWIATSFWLACAGAFALRRGSGSRTITEPSAPSASSAASASRTAILMPVYNEEAVEVFARLRAMIESVGDEGALRGFDFFVLSDSTDPRRWAAEEAEWHRLQSETSDQARLYYRRRAKNVGRKSGNIADFCVNWGQLYDYMVVLDADSLMTGETLVRLVRLMDANPRTALIQAPPVLVGGTSLFSRIQQFSSSVYGPLVTAGLDFLQGNDGNYWGHNAIIRVEPFIRHCGLPILPGKPPLGGEIMSHDFVEASLLRRAGWQVWMAPHLGGSYESAPPTLLEFLKRDRRWCQGNLQHIRLVFARGFRTPSRLHLATGVMSYLSSPLWLFLLIVYGMETFHYEQETTVVDYIGRYPVLAWPISHAVELITLVMAAATLLYGPKLLALLGLMRDAGSVRAHGGRTRLTLSVVGESIFSTLIAPVMMLSHSWFVFCILAGRGVGWLGQQRSTQGISLVEAARAFAPHTIVALVAAVAVWLYTPEIFWWYVPLLLGPILAILLYRVTSIPDWGLLARRIGLFLIPSEVVGVPVVSRFDAILAARRTEPAAASSAPRFVSPAPLGTSAATGAETA